MGMSASQARFLSLTARKNNVEFEGQQINQQRTTLSNESASYYSELCNMEVPTPPSIDDYTKVSYTFNDGAMTNTVISLLPKLDENGKIINNKYSINYIEEWQDDYAIVSASSNLVQKDGELYKIGNSILRKIDGEAVASSSGSNSGGSGGTTPVGGDDEGGNSGGTPSAGEDAGGNSGGTPSADDDAGGSTVNSRVLSAYEKGMIKYYDKETLDLKYFVGKENKIYDINDIEQKKAVTIDPSDYIIATEDEDQNVSILGFIDDEYVRLDDEGNPIEDSSESRIQNSGNRSEAPSASEEQLYSTLNSNVAVDKEISGDEYWNSLSESQRTELLETEKYYLAMLREKTGRDDENFYVRYVKNTTTGNYEPYFYSESELKNEQKYNDKNLGSIPCFSLGSTTKTKEILNQTGTIEKDASGRYVAITIELEDGTERNYKLTTTTTTDEEAYNDAMNQYNYKQHEYDHKIQEINSKLEIIQQQDKSLELKLKQLDTEENAISTEMDAVKKVISKNVESSFKTFNA